MNRRLADAMVLACTTTVAGTACTHNHAQGPRAPTASPLEIVVVPTPHLQVPRYETSGSIPQLAGQGRHVRRVNAGLRQAVLSDQRAYAPSARSSAKIAGRDCLGVYRLVVDRRLLSASTVVVSALLPATKLYPCGNEGQGWLSMTLRVPSGQAVTLAQLFRDEGLFALGVAWFRMLARRPDWRLDCVVAHLRHYEPTLQNYRYFALTPRGLALAFWQEPACSRIAAIVPYARLRPYLSRLGKQLIAGVRRPA